MPRLMYMTVRIDALTTISTMAHDYRLGGRLADSHCTIAARDSLLGSGEGYQCAVNDRFEQTTE